ncbi:T9SS type B sorting domain-containing protein [Cochleicola gelatinilyticus]|uniref:Uncharacterized protein n=1 Tax=Cochleicola gelatinilyticus TaxID=1763537 RepID=A0A167KB20_9FLAO|nr:T9SS type B sorting domain-containing protein [Cochleicola gelatinilyticus]OAB81633.1 hypothetical protein ULVI_00955 [Cochleicola gelatinilyticus]
MQVNLPPVLTAPTPLELCDSEEITGPNDEIERFDLTSKRTEITGGNLSVTLQYYADLNDFMADLPIATPTAYENVENPQTIYIRAEDITTGCVVQDQSITLDLVVNPLPSPATPTPLEVCDLDNDGFAFFTLTDKTNEIIAGEPGVVITYHETQTDAQTGSFALTSPYENITANTQTVYARATFPLLGGGTGCFAVVPLELIVHPTPILPLEIDAIVLCDDDADGEALFDLTVNEAQIYGSQDPANFTLTYHTSLADAQNGNAPIGNPESYTNMGNPQTIWVRLTDVAAATGCSRVGSFEISVSQGPNLTAPTPYVLCDDLGAPNDGQTTFNLILKNDEITGGGQPNLVVQYFETPEDAQNNTNAITPADTYINEMGNPHVLYIRVEDAITGCVETDLTLTLVVNPNPEPQTPVDPLVICDDQDPNTDNVFDLTQKEAEILNGENWELSYYQSYADAVSGDPLLAIVDPQNYTLEQTSQTIYVRATNQSSGCFEIVEIQIIISPLPDDSAQIDDLTKCEVNSNGTDVFDLTQQEQQILGDEQFDLGYEVTYYTTADAAMAGTPNIGNPTAYTNLTNPQEIFVGIEDPQTGCYIGGAQSFMIEVLEGAQAFAPTQPYVLCDSVGENDGITEFDLGSQSEVILGGQDPANYTVTYYETPETAEEGTNALPNLYLNIINPQIVYVRVTNNDTDCFATTELILQVEQLPQLTLLDEYRLCLDANGNPIPEEFGGASPPVIDTGLPAAGYSFVWEVDGVVLEGENGPSITATTSGSYTVTITEADSGCTTTVTTTVIESSPPITYDAILVNGAFADSHTIEVTAEGIGANEYEYALDDGAFQDSNIFENVQAETHMITIQDKNGCGSVTFEVGVIDYPLYFTPNEDNINDTWNIIGIGEQDPSAKIYIFDRYGKLLKQISPTGNGWDGTFNGNPMPSSDYWFQIEYTEQEVQKEFRGHFTLKR